MSLQNGWGRCPGCKAWNTFVEEPVSTVRKSTGVTAGQADRQGRANAPEGYPAGRRRKKNNRDRGIGQSAWRWYCARLSGSCGWRSGYRKVHPSFTGVQESFSGW